MSFQADLVASPVAGTLSVVAPPPGRFEPDLLPESAVFVETINLCGRRLLQVERLKGYLLANGFRSAASAQDASEVLVVGCAFNTHTERVSLAAIAEHRKRLQPGQRLFVLEGVADMCGDRLVREGLCEPGHVIPTTAFSRLDRYFARRIRFDHMPEANLPGQYDGLTPARMRQASVPLAPSERAVFSIQVTAGCADRCTYCGDKPIVGELRSRPLDSVLSQLRKGLASGYRAIELIGDDVGCYGLDIALDLPALLRLVAAESHGARLSLLEVNVKYLVRYESFLREFLSLGMLRKVAVAYQSGSDRILARMQRGYLAADVRRIASMLSAAGVWKHAHVIAGFPGETDAEFEASCDLLLDAGFESATLFLYQDRPGTRASAMQPKVSEAEKRRRLDTARERLAAAGFGSAAREDKLQVCRQAAPA